MESNSLLPRQQHPRAPIILPRNSILKGDLEISGRMHIDGRFIGNLKATREVVVGKLGICESKTIQCKELYVGGAVYGTIFAERISLSATAVVIGELHYLVLEVEHGAKIEGPVRALVDH